MTDVVSAQLQVTAQRVEAIRQLLEDPTTATTASAGATSASTDFARMLAETLDSAAAAQTSPALAAGASAALTAAAATGTLPPPEAIPPGYALVPLSSLTGAAAAAAPVPASPVAAVASTAPPSVVPPPSPQGAARVALALGELGVAEEPPGSNDSARIAEYRTATARAGVGPWCAYFTSWIGAQAGTPLGADGQGEGYVPTMANWLRGSGRYVTPTEGTPRPGDLVFFDWERDGELDHIGIVESVTADGRVHTIEGQRRRGRAAAQLQRVADRGLRPAAVAPRTLLTTPPSTTATPAVPCSTRAAP